MKKQKIFVLFIALLASCEMQEQDVAKKKVETPKPSTSVTVATVNNTTSSKVQVPPSAVVAPTPTPKPVDPKDYLKIWGMKKRLKYVRVK